MYIRQSSIDEVERVSLSQSIDHLRGTDLDDEIRELLDERRPGSVRDDRLHNLLHTAASQLGVSVGDVQRYYGI